MSGEMEFSGADLQFIVKSLGITCDAALRKRERNRDENRNRFHEATKEYLEADALLDKFRHELRERIMQDLT